MTKRDDTIAVFETAIAASSRFERKGKTMPYTSANGYMFSLVNKDDDLGVRLPKPRQTELLEAYGAGPYLSHGATMRDYVCLTPDMLDDADLVAGLLEEAYDFVTSLPPK